MVNWHYFSHTINCHQSFFSDNSFHWSNNAKNSHHFRLADLAALITLVTILLNFLCYSYILYNDRKLSLYCFCILQWISIFSPLLLKKVSLYAAHLWICKGTAIFFWSVDVIMLVTAGVTACVNSCLLYTSIYYNINNILIKILKSY